jgi:peroxiredoxin
MLAPDFTLQTLNGEKITLSDFRDKPVMLTFWRIDCPSCETQIPFLQGFYGTWSKAPLKMLTINAGDKAAAVSDFAARKNITFPILLDPDKKTAQAYGIPGVPVTFFIDTKGTVQAYKLGAFQSQQELEVGLDSLYPSLIGTPSTEKEE